MLLLCRIYLSNIPKLLLWWRYWKFGFAWLILEELNWLSRIQSCCLNPDTIITVVQHRLPAGQACLAFHDQGYLCLSHNGPPLPLAWQGPDWLHYNTSDNYRVFLSSPGLGRLASGPPGHWSSDLLPSSTSKLSLRVCSEFSRHCLADIWMVVVDDLL